jgi:hypothetical protein
MAKNSKETQILKRAQGIGDGELVSIKENSKTVKEEVLRRSAKAGYSTRFGEPVCKTKIQNSIPFGKQKLNVWERDENGNLID